MRTLLERFWTWVKTVLWPWTGKIFVEWWNAIGDDPGLHAISMVFGMLLLLALKAVV